MTTKPGRNATRRICIAVMAFGLLLSGALWFRTFVRIDLERQDAVGEATRKASALALAFEEHTARDLEQIDRQLLEASRAYPGHGREVDLRRLAASGPADSGLLRDLAVVNKEGGRELAAGGIVPADVSSEEYFIVHRDGRSHGTFLGRPSKDSLGDKWTIPVSRRIDNADGSFGGIVVASVDAARFSSFLRRVDLGSDGIVTLVGLDGVARVRESLREITFGQDMQGSALFRELPRRSVGDFAGTGRLDSVPRFYSFRSLAGYPLVVMVGISQAEALAASEAREHQYLLVAALGTLLIAAFVIGISVALRQHSRAMTLLAEAESRHREIFENTKDCIFLLDVTPERHFRFSALNPATEEILGLANADAAGKLVADVLPELEHRVVHNYLRCVDTAMPITYEEALELPSGLSHFQTTLLPIRVGEQIGRIVGVAHNITEHKNAELAIRRFNDTLESRVAERTAELAIVNQELAHAKERAEGASNAKSTFLATMSHEIRTPINGLLGALELLAQAPLDASDAELLEAARGSGKTLLRLLNDLLDMAKIEAGRIEIVRAPHSLRTIVERTLSTHRVNARRKDLQIRSWIDPRVPQSVLVDDLRVTQILGNLLGNAIKFTRAGNVSLEVSLMAQLPGASRLRFRVTDTGPGMDRATLARLFRPFEQGGAAREVGGTGLGLAISRGLAELMGGTITLESTPGAGTVADFELEVTPAQPEAAPAAADEPDIRVPVAPGTRALVVDDHPTNRMVLARQLEMLGCRAEQCEDGAQALARFALDHFDVVITDCEMPNMDGYDLARAIRAREGEGRRTPIIAYTAHTMAEVAARCQETGMDAVLHKPIVLANLAQVLAAHVPAARGSSPAEGAHAAAGPLDLDHLAQLSGGDACVERELFAQFRRSCLDDATALRRALEARDGRETARLAHRIKGASRTIGAFQLACSCERAERAARASDWNLVAGCLGDLDDGLQRVMDHVDDR